MRRRQLELTAVHESGHAIAAIEIGLGSSLRSASVRADSCSLGRVTFNGHPGLMNHPAGLIDTLAFQGFGPWSRPERLLMVTLAGPLAAEHCGAVTDERLNADAVTSSCWAEMLTVGTGETVGECLERFQGYTEELLDGAWAQVEAVTAALMARRTLSGAEVRRLAQSRSSAPETGSYSSSRQ
jgi:hypothetical protein